MSAKKLFYVVTVDWFFVSHFLERAVAARRAGYEVTVICGLGSERETLRRHGLDAIDWQVTRHGLNPWRELRAMLALRRIYRTRHPDLVHHVALKPIVYGSMAARLCGISRIVNAPVGMGFVFSSGSALARLLRPLVRLLLRGLLNPKGSRVVFENADDQAAAIRSGLVAADASSLIRGAGVDIDRFRPLPEPSGRPRIVLGARMLWDKGIGEFVRAATLVRARGIDAEWVLAGDPDSGNRASVSEGQLRAWHENGTLTWLGRCDEMPRLLSGCHIAALPSYREGLPKFLLEAMAAGRAIVATDVPGCREVCAHEINGLLVPPRDPQALADAVIRLAVDPGLRRRLAAAGRRRAEREFATDRVQEQTLRVYDQLSDSPPSKAKGLDQGTGSP